MKINKITQNIYGKYILTVVTLATFYLLLTTSAVAQSLLPLTVGPVRQLINVNPGEKTTLVVRFFNFSDIPVSGILRAADFVVEDNNGTPRIIEKIDQANPRFAASDWIDLPYDRMSIPANDKVTVQFNINVPLEAKPGGRYVSIYFEPTVAIPQSVNGPEEAAASITPRIASLIYMRVAGDITENALVSRFFAPSFFEYGPINVETQILNKGDYHIRPQGAITISNMFGNRVAQSSLKELNIFPDALRNYRNDLGSKWMFGKYRIDLSAAYGEKGQALTRSIEVWVFPWKIVTVILLAIALIFIVARNMVKKLSNREELLEVELQREREEIEKLKTQIRKRND